MQQLNIRELINSDPTYEIGDIIEIEMVFGNHVSKSFLVLPSTYINIIRKRK